MKKVCIARTLWWGVLQYRLFVPAWDHEQGKGSPAKATCLRDHLANIRRTATEAARSGPDRIHTRSAERHHMPSLRFFDT
ncbi:hypothetical protein DPMN_008605 [Dreissena polymorpha]|uniref:Secreted protein n=1 Tax=Dreissena polymorpha TaxID=45954 RepID=A0A9D4N0R3_DREPO|nr:hypothetical protein DPMN_008605 [Dreissena polymorpha]